MLITALVLTLLTLFGVGGGVAPILDRAREDVARVVRDDDRAEAVEQRLERAAEAAARANTAEAAGREKILALLRDYDSSPEDFAEAVASIDDEAPPALAAMSAHLRDARSALERDTWEELVRGAALEDLAACGKVVASRPPHRRSHDDD